jgi:hypothetical protein
MKKGYIKKTQHYVDNSEFLKQMIIYRTSYVNYKSYSDTVGNRYSWYIIDININIYILENLILPTPRQSYHLYRVPPKVSSYICECIMKISEGLSYRPNFINYTYRDDMVSDGIENCLLYINNFNPDKSDNPFSYFTQIIYFAFIRRIQKEKKQLYIKYKSIYSSNALESDGMNDNDVTSVKDSYLDYIRDNRSNIDKFLYEFEKFQEDKRISRNSVKPVKLKKSEKHNENSIDN